MTYNPEIAPVIKEALKDMPVVVIIGMRQSGKSTFLGYCGDTILNFRIKYDIPRIQNTVLSIYLTLRHSVLFYSNSNK